MSYHVAWTKKAKKELFRLHPKHQLLVASWIKDNLDGCSNPGLIQGSLKLVGTKNAWRYRIGSYRVIAQVVDDKLLIKIVRVGHRQGVYSNIPKG